MEVILSRQVLIFFYQILLVIKIVHNKLWFRYLPQGKTTEIKTQRMDVKNWIWNLSIGILFTHKHRQSYILTHKKTLIFYIQNAYAYICIRKFIANKYCLETNNPYFPNPLKIFKLMVWNIYICMKSRDTEIQK